MFIVTHDTLRNPQILETRTIPRKFIGRVSLFTRGASRGFVWRLVFEVQPLRYIVTLVPFVVAMFIWNDLALPLAQAPLAMILVIALVEMKALHYSDEARARLVTEAQAARILDLLTFRGRGMLAQIAARQGLTQGRLHLIVEQSEVARVTPLTLVSVQAEGPPRVLSLDEQDRAILAPLFDEELTEKALHNVNAQEKRYIRDVTFEAGSVSASARMAARLKAREAAE